MDKGIRRMTFIIIFSTLNILAYAKPAQDVQQGPCVGMDCLHGVLMHGDDEQGEDHKAEDQYLRFKETLETAENQPGPANAEEEFHGVLMHGDSETGNRHEEVGEILPEVKTEALPKDMNQELHEGMHGSGRVDQHDWDKADSEGVNTNEDDHEKLMHGLLMHGDENYVKHELESSDSTNGGNENKGPIDHEQLMHGLLLHGDASHGEHVSEEHSGHTGDVGPKTADDQLHGVLMHGDNEPGKQYNHDDIQEENVGRRIAGPTSDELHGILMHGDSEMGHDHTQEDADAISEVFRDFRKILELEIDQEILNMIDLEKILKNDIEDYIEWQAATTQYENAETMGSTYIDKSILDDIKLMKERYLSRENRDDAAAFTFGVDNDAAGTFTAEDAKSVLTDNAHTGEGEDMRHDLELMGNTDPLNDRHGKKQFN